MCLTCWALLFVSEDIFQSSASDREMLFLFSASYSHWAAFALWRKHSADFNEQSRAVCFWQQRIIDSLSEAVTAPLRWWRIHSDSRCFHTCSSVHLLRTRENKMSVVAFYVSSGCLFTLITNKPKSCKYEVTQTDRFHWLDCFVISSCISSGKLNDTEYFSIHKSVQSEREANLRDVVFACKAEMQCCFYAGKWTVHWPENIHRYVSCCSRIMFHSFMWR